MKSIGNLDPSRDIENAGNDRLAGSHDGPAAPRRSADAGDWLPDAAGAALGPGTPRCNSAARDHNTRRSKTSRGSQDNGKTAAGVQLLRESSSALTGGF